MTDSTNSMFVPPGRAAQDIILLLEKPEKGHVYGSTPGNDGLVIINKTAIAVRAYVSNLQGEERINGEKAILFAVKESNRDVISALVIELGLTRLLHGVKADSWQLSLLQGMRNAITSRPRAVSTGDLTTLKSWAHSVVAHRKNQGHQDMQSRAAWYLLDGIRDIERGRLLVEILREPNPAFDRDRVQVTGRLATLHAQPGVVSLLDDADRKAMNGEFHDGLHDLRRFFEQTLKLVCKAKGDAEEAEASDKKELPSRFKRLLEYAAANKIVTQGEVAILQGLYNLLSNEGSHALGSKEELYYVAKVTVVEWALLLTGRVGR